MKMTREQDSTFALSAFPPKYVWVKLLINTRDTDKGITKPVEPFERLHDPLKSMFSNHGPGIFTAPTAD